MPKDLTLQTTASGDSSRVPTQQGATHTPGPWKSHPASAVVGALVSYGDITKGESIAAVMPQINMAECTANASLIAQSPALLAELKSLRKLAEEAYIALPNAKHNEQLIKALWANIQSADVAIQAAEGSDRP